MKVKGIVGLLIASFIGFTGCASTQSAESNLAAADPVYFSTSQAHGNFTIACRPRTEEIGKTAAWVDTCNDLGREALDKAAKDGLITPVNGPAFGMSSEFIKSMPADAPVSSKAMSRDIPLIGMAL